MAYRVRWGKVTEKAAAVFGCVFLLTVTSEEFILPVVSLILLDTSDTSLLTNVVLDDRSCH